MWIRHPSPSLAYEDDADELMAYLQFQLLLLQIGVSLLYDIAILRSFCVFAYGEHKGSVRVLRKRTEFATMPPSIAKEDDPRMFSGCSAPEVQLVCFDE